MLSGGEGGADAEPGGVLRVWGLWGAGGMFGGGTGPGWGAECIWGGILEARGRWGGWEGLGGGNWGVLGGDTA